MEHAARAWISGVDGHGSRAVWIVFEGAYGAATLCSLILNDTVGVVDAAGGAITKKRLEAELAALRASQKLPWVELDPARAVGLVAEALALHRARATAPPAAFARWAPRFGGAAPAPVPELQAPDPALVERAAELLELPELAGWFLDPESVQADAIEREAARASRLVVPEPVKAERDAAQVRVEPVVGRRVQRRHPVGVHRPDAPRERRADQVIDEAVGPDDPARHPLARGLALRALDVAAEVAAGRIPAADASRRP